MPRTLADRVVNISLRVRPDETVVINTWQHTITLASDIAFEARKARAIPIIRLETDELWWKVLNKIPSDDLRKPERHGLRMLDETNVNIMLGGPEDPAAYRHVDGAKLAATLEPFQAWYEKVREKKIRVADLLIGQVTKQRAKTYGFNYTTWRKTVDSASNVDYAKMAQLGKRVASILDNGKRVEVSGNGTKLAMEIGGHPANVEDGIVDEQDVERGFLFTSIPTGLVITAPLPSSAEGTVKFDLPRAQKGRLIRGLTWEFQNGQVVRAGADKYADAFLDLYNPATGDKDRIASLSIGINPTSKPVGYTNDDIGLGVVSTGIGENQYLGGNNRSEFGFTGSLSKATLKIDGKTLINKGRLVL